MPVTLSGEEVLPGFEILIHHETHTDVIPIHLLDALAMQVMK
jgi:hypothetical protein